MLMRLVLLASLLFSPYLLAAPSLWQETVVDEPIFSGRVLIREAGDPANPTVLLIHGISDDASNEWRHQFEILAKEHFVVAMDLPGFGGSDKGNKLYSPQRYAELINWIVERRIFNPFAIVGHSMGGSIALYYAGSFKHPFARIVAVDAAGILHKTSVAKTVTDVEVNADSWWKKAPAKVTQTFNRIVNNVLEDTNINLETMLHSEFQRKNILGGEPNRIAGLALIVTDFSDVLDAITQPVTIIWGEKDTISPLRTAYVITQRVKNSTLHVLPNASHNPMLEYTDEFNLVLLKALNGQLESQDAPQNSPVTKNAADAIGRCYDKDGMEFNGDYQFISIHGCENVVIRDAKVGFLDIKSSIVNIENSHIRGDAIGMKTYRSRVTATALTVRAPVAVEATQSRLDLAGVDLIAENEALMSKGEAKIVFSVSRIKSKHHDKFYHGIYEIRRDNPL
ncbi:alpha/beta fold hydrolase [Kaarinaea lacus]